MSTSELKNYKKNKLTFPKMHLLGDLGREAAETGEEKRAKIQTLALRDYMAIPSQIG